MEKEAFTCPCCGSDKVKVFDRTEMRQVAHKHYVTGPSIEFECEDCEEEWIQEITGVSRNLKLLVNEEYSNLKYDVDVAKFFGLGYSDLMNAETTQEKLLVLAMYNTLEKLQKGSL